MTTRSFNNKITKPTILIVSARWNLYGYTPESHLQYSLNVTKQFTKGNIILVGAFPEWSPSLPKAILAHMSDKKQREIPYRLPAAKSGIAINAALSNMASRSSVYFASPSDYFCTQTDCAVRIEDTITIFDDSHLSDMASIKFIADHVAPKIDEALASQQTTSLAQ